MMFFRFLANALLVFGSLAVLSCSSSSSGKCEGSFESVGRMCPRSFDGTLADLPACGTYATQAVTTCGDLIVLTNAVAFGYWRCFFDVSSHGLVGAEDWTDTNSYCGGTSFSIQTGKVPSPGCNAIPPALTRDCEQQRDAATPE